jgi:LuxR family maltose regulon positive regulatory protein
LDSDANLPPLVRARNAACHTQIALAQGDLATATRWADQMWDDADASSFYPGLNLPRARLLMAQEHKEAAKQWLESCCETATQKGIKWGMVRACTLQALVAPEWDAALPFLAEALTMAEPEGLVRTFIDEGAPLAALLQRAAEQGIACPYAQRLLAAWEADVLRKTGENAPSPPQPLIEPLSQRELEVLRLAAEGLTNLEIAQTLYVSINTVKTHLRNIYGKLGVTNRRAATAKATALGLIP